MKIPLGEKTINKIMRRMPLHGATTNDLYCHKITKLFHAFRNFKAIMHEKYLSLKI